MAIAVTINEAPAAGAENNVVVEYSTLPGTAQPNVDYTPTTGTLTFTSASQTTQTFNVTLLNNATSTGERRLNLVLRLNTPNTADLARGDAILIITDDDPTPTPTVRATAVTGTPIFVDLSEPNDSLEQAYELFPEPVLLYNLARAYEGKGELATAADKYEQYLRLAPTASARGAIEQRVLNLRRVLARRRVSQRSPGPGPTQASSPNARSEAGGRWLPWALVVTGGAVSASGGVLGLLARQKESDARSATNHRDASASWDEAENRATLANIAFVAGGALIVGASVWLVLSRSGDSVTLGISPNGVVARGSL